MYFHSNFDIFSFSEMQMQQFQQQQQQHRTGNPILGAHQAPQPQPPIQPGQNMMNPNMQQLLHRQQQQQRAIRSQQQIPPQQQPPFRMNQQMPPPQAGMSKCPQFIVTHNNTDFFMQVLQDLES